MYCIASDGDYRFCLIQVRTKRCRETCECWPLHYVIEWQPLGVSRSASIRREFEPIRSIESLVRPLLQFKTPSWRLRTQEGILPLFQREAARHSHLGLIDESLRRRKNAPNPSRAVIRCR